MKCHTARCNAVPTHTLIWLGERLEYCEPCANKADQVAGVMGMGSTKQPLTPQAEPSHITLQQWGRKIGELNFMHAVHKGLGEHKEAAECLAALMETVLTVPQEMKEAVEASIRMAQTLRGLVP